MTYLTVTPAPHFFYLAHAAHQLHVTRNETNYSCSVEMLSMSLLCTYSHFLVSLIASIFIAVNELPLERGMNGISRPNGATSTKFQRNAPQAAFSGAIYWGRLIKEIVCVCPGRESAHVRSGALLSCSDIMLS
jgi:hypothetical protein